MSRETTYAQISEYAKSNNYKLVTTENEFYKLKEEQNKSGAYVKLLYRCKCGNSLTRDYPTLRRSGCNCKQCSRKNTTNAKRLSFDKQVKIIEDKGLSYVEGDILNHDSTFFVRCGCGNNFKTTLRVIKNSKRDIMQCKQCQKENQSRQLRKPFSELKNFLESKGCNVISEEQDYRNAYSKITFVARCGHPHTTTARSILNTIKHYVCSDCRKLLTSGENNYNWKGGYENERIRFRKTYEFKTWVKEVYKRDGYTCQCCGRYGVKLNAHHLDGYNWCIEKRTDVDNGITLCKNCHNNFHNIYGRGNNTKKQFEEFLLSFSK